MFVFYFSQHRYGDLYFEMTTGSAPAFTYTLALSFDYKPVPGVARSSCTPRWQMTAIEYAAMLKHKEMTKTNDLGEMVPIFKTETQQTIETMELLHLRLDYCFGAHPQYNITITTVADDRLSGFATYACVKTYVQQAGKCDTKTNFKDISGGAANFVLVHLNGPQDYGPVEVIVRGDGRFAGDNLFTLAASAPSSPWMLDVFSVFRSHEISRFLLLIVSVSSAEYRTFLVIPGRRKSAVFATDC